VSGYIEDFRVGQREERPGHPVGDPCSSAAIVLDLLSDAGNPLDLRWRFGETVGTGDVPTLTSTITRCRVGSDGSGIVHRHLLLTGCSGAVLGEGTAVFSLPVKESGPITPHLHTDYGSLPWAHVLGMTLTRNEEFVSATRPMDGAMAFRCGEETVQFRVYKGQLVDVARATPAGPTFTVSGSELAWVDLVSAPRNDFIARTMAGDFIATGNTHEYLRFTKAVVSAWDSIRELARRDVD